MNWSIWDTVFIVAGLASIALAFVPVARSLSWVRWAGIAGGAVLVLFGVWTGLQLEAIYPLVLLAFPLVIAGLVIWGATKRDAQVRRPDAPAAALATASAPAAGRPAPALADQPAPVAPRPAVPGTLGSTTSTPSTPSTPSMTSTHPDDASSPAPAGPDSANPAPVASAGPVPDGEIDEPRPSVADGAGHEARAGAEPKASGEDIDAALAEWYFEPYDGERGPDGGAPLEQAEPGAAASAAPAGHAFTAAQAADPATPAGTLHEIAAAAPELHAELARNPALYPELRDWLRSSPDPAVQAALAARGDAS